MYWRYASLSDEYDCVGRRDGWKHTQKENEEDEKCVFG